ACSSCCARPAWRIAASWSAASFPRETSPSCSRWAWPASSRRARACRRSSISSASGAPPAMPDLDALVDAFRHGDRRALARLLTCAANGRPLPALPTPTKPCRVVAVTGSGGVGKSTLVGKLIDLLRTKNLTVAVLACDPQSPLSGGALLGDR